jgi:lysophospholipase L1-like esterase
VSIKPAAAQEMKQEVKISPTRSISAGKGILFTTILLAAFLLIGEAAIRVWSYYFRTSYEVFDSTANRYVLVPGNYTFKGGTGFTINSRGFVGPEFEAEKTQEVKRIFALGDSCTFGAYDFAYPGLVDRAFNTGVTERKYEVINAGVEGYNSMYALARLKEDVLQYDPDLVTVYIGWNDLMKVNPDHLSASGQYTGLATFMEYSYLLKAYKKLIFYYLRPHLVRPKVLPDEHDIHAYDNFIPSEFQANLEHIIALLKERHIEVLVMTRPTVVSRGMRLDDIERQNVIFPYFAGSYSVDRLLSLHQAYNRVINRVATSLDVQLLDLDAIFNRYNKNELFWDTMHPNERGQQLIAESLVRKLREMGF